MEMLIDWHVLCYIENWKIEENWKWNWNEISKNKKKIKKKKVSWKYNLLFLPFFSIEFENTVVNQR